MKLNRLFLLSLVFGFIAFSCSDDVPTSPPTGSPGEDTEDTTEESGGEVTEVYTLAVEITPDGSGEVEPSEGEFEDGEELELTAEPGDAYRFVEWEGDLTGSDNPVTLDIESDLDIIAVFERREYPLDIDVEGEGAVSEEVIASPSDYEHGTTVMLTAEPASGWEFVEWQGDLLGSENPATITVEQETSVTAVFERKEYSLTTLTDGEGTVTRDPDLTEYEYESAVNLTADPADNWEFVEWTGDVESTENPLDVTVESDTEITAVFEIVSYSLHTDVSGEGDVVRFPDQEEYDHGTQVQLTGSPDGDWVFDEWQGDADGNNNPLVITIEEETNITAVFAIFTSGSGTSADPYQVSNLTQLQAMGREEYLDRHFVQVNDINASDTENWNGGAGFEPIGSSSYSDRFSGSFDGGDYVISGLTINRPDERNIGLFGYARGSTIENVGLEDVNITGDRDVGGLAGYNAGEIRESFATGEVTASRYAGGLVGYNAGEIFDSYAIATVEVTTSSIGHAGGLVGMTRQLTAGVNPPSSGIYRSYAASTVTGGGDVGGFIGRHDNEDNPVLEDNYWDSDLESIGIGGYREVGGGFTDSQLKGLSTSEMQGTSASGNMTGFNFTTIWQTVSSDYPILRWQ